MTKSELIDAFWQGDIGELEFWEVGLDVGINIDELAQIIDDVRMEDGVPL
jgi:hypothetical protein